jgi:hypothetical protein
MRCATIIISLGVGVLPSPMQSITASTNKGLVDRDMLRHLIAACARRRCRRLHRHGGRLNRRQTEYSTNRTAQTLYLLKLHRRVLERRRHFCRDHGDDRELGSASARSAERLPYPTFKIAISPKARSANEPGGRLQPGKGHVFQSRPLIPGNALRLSCNAAHPATN